MKKLVSLFVNNSILVNFVMVFILVIGIMSTFSIKKEQRPSVDFDRVVVGTSYIGASPDEVERLITIPIEEELSSISGIDAINSISYTGRSSISIDIQIDYSNKYEVVQDIFRAVDNVKNLPDDSEDPITVQIKAQIIPIYNFALYGDASARELKKWSEYFEEHIRVLDGVSEVSIAGTRDPSIEVIVDPKKLKEKSVSISEIMSTLSSWNKSAPAGYIKDGSKEFAIRIDENFNNKGKIESIIIRTNDMGEKISVREVAKVKDGFINDRKLKRFNGKRSVTLDVKKQENADTIKTVNRVKKEIAKLKNNLPKNITFYETRNEAERVETKVYNVAQNAIIGLVLVVIVLLLMLNWRIALVTAMGLPVAFFGSIYAMELLGYTLNSMTLIGLILVVGMLVDDGIVVAENIFFHYEKGKTRKQAAIDGASEIIIPVIGTVLTTIVAFLPLVFLGGIVGKFMAVVPVGVITCLVFSLFECVVILPNHASEFMNHSKSRVTEKLNLILENTYRPALNFVIRKRWIVAPVIFILIIIALVVNIKTFKMVMFPTRGVTKFDFNIEAPANTRLEASEKVVKKIEKVLNGHIGKDIENYSAIIGATAGRQRLGYSGTNTSGVSINLFDEDVLDTPPRDIIKTLRKEINPLIPDGWQLSFELKRHGPPMGKAVDIEISHSSFEKIYEVSALIKEKLAGLEGTADVRDDIVRGFYEYKFEIDKEKASILGVDPTNLQRVAMSSFEGIAATKVRKIDDEYDVVVTYPKEYREDKNNLLNLQVKTKYSTYVSLGKIAKLVKQKSVGAINHVNEKRTVVVSSSLTGKKITGFELNKKMEDFVNSEIKPNFPDVIVNFSGEEEKRREMMTEITQLFILALLAIFMILSLVFNSIVYPFFVILVIPFGIVGGMIALTLYGEVVSFPGLISFVGLTGIVVNDAIILVTYIRDKYKESKNIMFSVVEGGMRRIRPIFITTVTTVIGLSPAIYELGGSDSNMRSMAIVIAWGLLFATIMTMLFIPPFMACLFEVGIKLKTLFQAKKNPKVSAS